MARLIRIAGDCPDNQTCPAAWINEEDPESVYVVGAIVTDDPDVQAKAGEDEAVVRIPRSLWVAR